MKTLYLKLNYFTLKAPLLILSIIVVTIFLMSKVCLAQIHPEDEVHMSTLPSHWDWRELGKVTPVKDQGSCGSDYAFSVVAAVESKILILADVEMDLAEQVLVSCDSDGGCDGGSPMIALDYIRDNGLVNEEIFPYQGINGVPCEQFPQENHAKIEGYYNAKIGDDNQTKIANIKEAIFNDGPVVAIMEVYTDFYSYSSGIYTHVAGTHQGAHSIILVGWDDTEDYWIAKNSWGPWWGGKWIF